MQEINGADVAERVGHPFVRHHVDPTLTTRAWIDGDAVVVDGVRGRPGESDPGPVYTALGPVDRLVPLMQRVSAVAERPSRLRIEHPATPPAAWDWADHHDWHWMVTQTAPEPGARRVAHLDEERDASAIHALLDLANPDSFARPGAPGVAVWLGVRDQDGGLRAVGALQPMHDATLHVRGVAVLPAARGQGIGRDLSAALTRHSLEHGSGVATLGVYTDNEVAVRLYTRLGYRVAHTFRSGVLAP